MRLRGTNCGKMMEDRNLGNSVEEEDEDYDCDISRELADTSDLPTSLIITNLDPVIFADQRQKSNFEEIFRQYEENATFQYFKSFRRARVNFSSPESAASARIQSHQTRHADSVINCYFAQPAQASKDGDSEGFLQPPSPVRQFLISPPASPPVGWEPQEEAEPCINYDLLSAVATLKPGEPHELHPASSSQPGIVVHVCEDINQGVLASPKTANKGQKVKINQTRCPERKHSLESPDSPSPPSSPSHGTS